MLFGDEFFSVNTLTAMSTNIVDMAVFNEAVSTIFVDGYLSVSSAGNNCCIPYTVYVLCYFYGTKDLFRPVDVLFCDGGKIFLVAPLRFF